MYRTPRLSLKRRAGALWVLLCWLWLGTVAPFAHTCVRPRAEHRASTTVEANAACLSCQWLFCEKSADAAPAPSIPLPRATAYSLPLLSDLFSSESLLTAAPRAPPFV